MSYSSGCQFSCGIVLLVYFIMFYYVFFFFKQKTAYEMRISDWSSDVCSSDLVRSVRRAGFTVPRCGEVTDLTDHRGRTPHLAWRSREIGRASCRERVCQYV